MTNIRIRIKMIELNIRQWEVAKLLGISESALSRKLRVELSEEEQTRIIDLIENTRGGDCDE